MSKIPAFQKIVCAISSRYVDDIEHYFFDHLKFKGARVAVSFMRNKLVDSDGVKLKLSFHINSDDLKFSPLCLYFSESEYKALVEGYDHPDTAKAIEKKYSQWLNSLLDQCKLVYAAHTARTEEGRANAYRKITDPFILLSRIDTKNGTVRSKINPYYDLGLKLVLARRKNKRSALSHNQQTIRYLYRLAKHDSGGPDTRWVLTSSLGKIGVSLPIGTLGKFCDLLTTNQLRHPEGLESRISYKIDDLAVDIFSNGAYKLTMSDDLQINRPYWTEGVLYENKYFLLAAINDVLSSMIQRQLNP